jgi:streptogramin lyase
MRPFKNSSWSLAASLALACLGGASYASPWHPHPLEASAPQTVVGDVVERLGDNLMLVHQDKSNRWWFGTWGDGLYRYDGRRIVHFTTTHGLSHNRIDQILEDSAGRLFFSTPSGVNCFDGEKFSKLPVSSFSVWKLMPGDLWFTNSKYDGSVLRYDGETLHSLQLPKVKIGEDYVAKHHGAAIPYGVYTIYRDEHEHVWFGTAAVGVCRYDGKSFEWLTSDDVNELHQGPANGVRSIVEDHEGHFWFNTRYRYAVDPSPLLRPDVSVSEGIFRRLPGMGSLDGRPDGDYEYLSITKDPNNSLWIATYSNGAYCFDGKQLKHYPIMDGSKTVNLFTVYADRAGTIWLGTHAHGVYRFNGTAFERFVPD